MKPKYLHLIALVLLLAGVGLIMVRHIGDPPQVTCVEKGPTSGFSIEKDGQECPLNEADFRAYWHWEHNSAVPLHLAGLGCVALSLATEVTGLVVGHKQKKRKREAAAPGTSTQA